MRRTVGFNRILSMVALFAIVFVVLFSASFISNNLGHHCDDQDHCPVCTFIIQCQQNIKTIGTGLIAAASVIFISTVLTEVAITFEYQSVQTTLVSQKVRLDS